MATSLLRAGPLAADFVSGTNRPTLGVRNGHRVAKFPNVIDTETFFTLNMPTVFANGDIEVKIHWMGETAIVGDVVWAVAFERHQPGVDDLDSDSFAADIQAAAETVAGVSGQTIETVIAVSAAQYDGISQGNQFRLRVKRVGTIGSDTMIGNAQLMTVVIEQLADPAGGGGGGFWSDGAGTRAGIGQGSPAPVATGLEALAHGTDAYAYGDHSIAFGQDARVRHNPPTFYGTYGIAIGYSSDCQNLGGIAIGWNTRAGDSSPVDKIQAVAIGYYAQASGRRAIAIGYNIDAGGAYSIAIGAYSVGDQLNDIAIGHRAVADGHSSYDPNIAIGYNCVNDGYDNISIGRDAYSTNYMRRSILIGSASRMSTSLGYNTCRRSVLIGFRNELWSGSETFGMGYDINATGSNNVIIGTRLGYNSNIEPPDGFFASVVIHGGDSSDHGIYTGWSGDSAYANGNISIGTADSGIHAGFQNREYNNYNLFMGVRSSHLYSRSYGNIVFLTASSSVGDNFSSTPDYKNQNIVMLSGGGGVMDYGGEYRIYRNIIIGYQPGRMAYSYGNIAIGIFGGVYDYGYKCDSIVTIGMSTWSYGASQYGGNFITGYRVYMYQNAAGTQYNHDANFIAGRYCTTQHYSGTSYMRASIAQGMGVRAEMWGQRAFGSGSDTSGNMTNPNQRSFIVDNVQTTDAVQTTLMVINTIVDKAYAIKGEIIAFRTDVNGESANFTLALSHIYRNPAAVPVLIGDPVAWVQGANQGAPAWTIDTTITGNTLLIRVTGEALKTINWLANIELIEVRG